MFGDSLNKNNGFLLAAGVGSLALCVMFAYLAISGYASFLPESTPNFAVRPLLFPLLTLFFVMVLVTTVFRGSSAPLFVGIATILILGFLIAKDIPEEQMEMTIHWQIHIYGILFVLLLGVGVAILAICKDRSVKNQLEKDLLRAARVLAAKEALEKANGKIND